MTAPFPGSPVRGSQSGRSIMALFDLLGRRWSMRILWELGHTRSSFRELQRRCDGVSSSVLNTRLGELKDALLVDLGADGYCLTELGEQLMAHVAPLRHWAEQWRDELGRQSDDMATD